MLLIAAALYVGTALASSCTANDKTVWDDKVKGNFQADEKHCALRCGGANPCTGDCVSNTYGLSHDCGQCFGSLSECVVRHCVVYPGNCGINPNGASCKKCTDQHCSPAFESCTGFTPPSASFFLGTTLANPVCNAHDKTVWDSTVKPKFQADEKHCALRCGGANPCTGDCISKTYGLSQQCGQCFGSLSECVARHCIGLFSGNCAINENGESCKKCTEQHCTPSFEACTGFTPPSVAVELEVSANMCCEDGCGTDGWYDWSTKAKYCPMACGYCFNKAELMAPAKLQMAPWCKYIGAAVQPSIPECSGDAKTTLTTTLGTDPSWCQYIGAAVKPYIKACSGDPTLTTTLGTDPSWCQYIGADAKKIRPGVQWILS